MTEEILDASRVGDAGVRELQLWLREAEMERDRALTAAEEAIAVGNVAAIGWDVSKARCLELEVELETRKVEWLRITDSARAAIGRCDAALREIAAMEPRGPAQEVARSVLRFPPLREA